MFDCDVGEPVSIDIDARALWFDFRLLGFDCFSSRVDIYTWNLW